MNIGGTNATSDSSLRGVSTRIFLLAGFGSGTDEELDAVDLVLFVGLISDQLLLSSVCDHGTLTDFVGDGRGTGPVQISGVPARVVGLGAANE